MTGAALEAGLERAWCLGDGLQQASCKKGDGRYGYHEWVEWAESSAHYWPWREGVVHALLWHASTFTDCVPCMNAVERKLTYISLLVESKTEISRRVRNLET